MRIEYEDSDLLVVYKEAGLPVQTGRTSQRDLVSLLKNHLAMSADQEWSKSESSEADRVKNRAGLQKGEPYLGIVHRLDQPVEGLLVFAKTPKAAAALSAQAAAKAGTGSQAAKAGAGVQVATKAGTGAQLAKAGTGAQLAKAGTDAQAAKGNGQGEAHGNGMEKIYQALVCLDASSYPLAIDAMKREVTLTDWIGRDRTTNMAYIADEEEKGAKRAELVFRTLWIKESKALLEIRLHTGRHHQIRVQMAHAGMPILGDRKYGTDRIPEARKELADSTSEGRIQPVGREKEIPAAAPLCLCAAQLSFFHPAAKKRMTFRVTPAWLPAV